MMRAQSAYLAPRLVAASLWRVTMTFHLQRLATVMFVASLAFVIASDAATRGQSPHESVLYAFVGGTDGAAPLAGLIAGPNGDLYGTTTAGGSGYGNCLNGCGIVFRLTPSGSSYIDRVLFRFRYLGGFEPYGAGVIRDDAGALYGMTAYGGCCGNPGQGTAFKLTRGRPGFDEHGLYTFRGGLDGAHPSGGLTPGAGGVFYGTTPQGGVTGSSPCTGGNGGCGTVFKLTPSGTRYKETVLYRFRGGTDGANPEVASVIEGAGGVLYGTTEFGGVGSCSGSGSNGCGTVFKLTPSGSSYAESVLYSFQAGTDGANPRASLIIDKSGALYGTTAGGGLTPSVCGWCGVVFKLTPSGSGYVESVLYRFLGGSDGLDPQASLLADKNGTLSGTTVQGGGSSACSGGCGTVFKLTPSGSAYKESVLHRFSGGKDGANPAASLIVDANGVLYGTTLYGGGSSACSGGCGTVFKVTP
jgi:hypothetical protein